jgi:hypothetical protein
MAAQAMNRACINRSSARLRTLIFQSNCDVELAAMTLPSHYYISCSSANGEQDQRQSLRCVSFASKPHEPTSFR